ncbi:MAG: 2-amino-4-hydroxy-6-hydroxymethyldihydropteridine diphosphokinase [Pseudomonadota bacterium]|nr:2-amino-4-hydroxy-6-hydroxymethyldihydropteridine diphosphokinase [Pseudomonadota bacterium]
MSAAPPLAPVRAYIGLGGNLDDPAARIRRAFTALAGLSHTRLAGTSSLYRTAPVGYLDQPDFINAVAAVDTTLPPLDLLDALLALELDAGRERSFRNAPRTLDLDLLLYGDLRLDHPRLTLPHPRMGSRAFVLAPLAELTPGLRIAELGEVGQLAAACADQGVKRLAEPAR